MALIKKALISVSNKEAIGEFAKQLQEFGVEILSTGGTAKILKSLGIDIINVSQYTGFPEMLNGRVKTLHPRIHAAILADRSDDKHMQELKEQGIELIDMVVVNLYPFEEVISKDNHTLKDAIENIDIGGPTLLRSAAKNYQWVTVIVDPSDYTFVIEEMEKNGGEVSAKTNLYLAKKVFQKTSQYDLTISKYLSSL